MTVRELEKILEAWAPREIAWERDNIGLQVGDPKADISGILVCLDASLAIAKEAVRKRANLIVSHHPLLFKPLKSLRSDRHQGAVVAHLVRSGISLYSAHTNLDFTRGGTSFALAHTLGLREVDVLARSFQVQRKIVTFVPPENAESVAAAMADAGAGRIGNYEFCSFRTEGTGTFRGNEFSQPAVGKRGRLERVSEVRLEMIVPAWRVASVISAMRQRHPYEEPAYDVYPLQNTSGDYGMGVIGSLDQPVRFSRFLADLKRSLSTPAVRYCGDRNRQVRRIAACGGGGSDLLEQAVDQGAEVFVTADVTYHTFEKASGTIALVDAGHYETEYPLVAAVVARLRSDLRKRGERIPVHAASASVNPVQYV